MNGVGKGLPNYLRDIRLLRHKPSDFIFRVLARFDNQIEMLKCEQKFLAMYWGTINCYNDAFEVSDGLVKKTLVAWNMETLETRQYLSCHAVSKDLGIGKEEIREVLHGEKLCSNAWVFEAWGNRRTVAKVVDMYGKCGIPLPEHALNPKNKNSMTPIPGICSIAQLVYRERYRSFSPYSTSRRIRLRPNHQEQFW